VFPLDDEFAQMVGDYSSLDQLKQKLTENLRQQKHNRAETALADQALQHIVEQAPRVEWHKSLEDRMLDRVLEDEDRLLKQQNLNLDTYLSAQQKTREGVRKELRPAMQQRLRRSLVVNELVKREGLSVEGNEIAEQIDSLSFLAGERGSQLRQMLTSSQGVEHVANELLNGKLRERLVQIVTGQLPAEQPAEPAQPEPAAEQPVFEESKEQEVGSRE
jgi:FKBP-type peptidyl-prolyl cis-trans isomerase (trigger factor)